jgi:hypothetical protein
LNDKAIMDQTIFIDYNKRIKELDVKLEQLTTLHSTQVNSHLLKTLIENASSLDKALGDQASNYPEGPSLSC